jgi:hypothetical protein
MLGITAWGQPALTTIQDVLYRADGTRFNGTMHIRWNSFQGGDSSNIATGDVTLQIVNGVLRVRLVPTTNASAGANYQVTYNSRGRMQFSETWAVPPSSTVLRVRDVRGSSGTVVGPETVSAPVQISDVVGLTNELALRPQKGAGFQIARAAVINTAGQIDGATGSLGDCVRVDGTSGPCGAGGGGVLPAFADHEVPSGLVNGTNTVFTLTLAPQPAASLALYRNGLLQRANSDFTLSGATITFLSGSTPQAGDLLTASYRYGDPSNPLGTLTAAQVVCSSTGGSTTSASLTTLGACTVPAGLLAPGDRVEIRYDFAHTGASSGIGFEVKWGLTTLVSRSTALGESLISGKNDLGLSDEGAQWSGQSWGAVLNFAAATGTAQDDISQAMVITLRGQVLSGGGDSVILRNFSVIRYPAQANP